MQKKYFTSQNANFLINTYGFALFPVHGIDENGNCTCGNLECKQKGKHPATRTGFKEATNNYEEVVKLFKEANKKGLNVGVATGEPSGIFVIDIDSAEGFEEVKRLCGGIPNTLRVDTAKGCHLYFKYPNEQVVTKRGILNGVDVRGDGGYVVGVFSNHESGAVYDFVNPLEEFADAPEAILNLVVKSRIKETPKAANTNSLNIQPLHSSGLHLNKTTPEQAKEHLSYISPDCGYDEWIAVGMALKDEGLPFSLWDDWSKQGAKYDRTTAIHWNSFKGTGTSYGSLVHLAKQGGWRPKDIVQIRHERSETIINPHVSQEAMQKTHSLISEFDEVIGHETGEIIEAVDTHKQNESTTTAHKETTEYERKKPSMYYVTGDKVGIELEANDFVQGVLTNNGLSMVYGESNCGKTFFMTDLAFHISEGLEWRNKRVQGGAVLYAVLEGASGLRGRIEAYKRHTGNQLSNFAMMPCPVDFMDAEGNINEFIDLLHKAKAEFGELRLIVIDTLARAMGGGDENSGQDMGILVKHADYIRSITGAHICFVHHSGKDKAKGARGHSSLRAAVDTEIEVSRNEGDEYSTVTIVKQRDLSIPDEPYYFKLERVVLGLNQYHEEVTSCVVLPCDGEQRQKGEKPLTAIEQIIYDAICEAIIDYGVPRNVIKGVAPIVSISYEDMRIKLEEKGFKEFLGSNNLTSEQQVKNATTNNRMKLRNRGLIGSNKDYIWLVKNTNFET